MRDRPQRRRVLKAGAIEFGGGAIDCTIRNISQCGAALDVESPIGIPERFYLLIPTDNRRVRCYIRWRKDTRIGVAFEDMDKGRPAL